MPGCWVRSWNDDEDGFEYVEPCASVPGEVYVTDNEVVCELLGPNGEVISQMLEREPIGFRAGRW